MSKPSIKTFRYTYDNSKRECTLHWEVENATNLTLNPGTDIFVKGNKKKGTYTFKLEFDVYAFLYVSNKDGGTNKRIKISVPPPPQPKITSFTYSYDEAKRECTVNWELEDVDSRWLSLEHSDFLMINNEQKSHTFKLERDTSATLRAHNKYGSTSKKIKISVPPPPQPKITSFTYSYNEARRECTLNWELEDVDSRWLSLDHIDFMMINKEQKSHTFKLESDTTATLRASNKYDNTSKKIKISVPPPPKPKITSFTYSYDQAKRECTVNWELENVDSRFLSLEHIDFMMIDDKQKSHTFKLENSTSATLRASNKYNSTSKKIEISVPPPPKPKITSFTYSYDEAKRECTVNWELENVDSRFLSLEHFDFMMIDDKQKSHTFKLENSTSATLRASNKYNSTSKKIKISVPPPPKPKITSFTYSYDEAKRECTLKWELENVDSRFLSLEHFDFIMIDDKQKSHTFKLENSTSATLRASNKYNSTSKKIKISVPPPPKPKITSFDYSYDNAKRECTLNWELEDVDSRWLSLDHIDFMMINKEQKSHTFKLERDTSATLRASNKYSNTNKRIKISVPPPVHASWSSKKGAKATFVNNSPLFLTLEWIDLKGKTQQLAELAPGKSCTKSSFIGHNWKLIDKNSQTELLTYRLKNKKENISFTGEHLKSKKNGKRTDLYLNNGFPFELEVFKVEANGKETSLCKVNSGGSKKIQSRENEVLRARQPETDTEAGLFIVSEHEKIWSCTLDGYHLLPIGFIIPDPDHSRDLHIENRTPLPLQLKLVTEEKEEFLFKNLSAGEQYKTYGKIGSSWRVTELNSQILVDQFTLDPGEEAQQEVIRADDITAQPGKKVKLTLKNNTPFRLAMYELDDNDQEILKAIKDTKQSLTVNTNASRTWLFRHHSSKKLVDMYVPTSKSKQSHTLVFKTGSGWRKTIEFVNDTLLTLSLTRIRKTGSKQKEGPLYPGQKLKVKTSYISAAWIVKDIYSGRIVDFVRQTSLTNQVKINDQDLVPIKVDKQVTATFTNKLPFPVNLFKINETGEEELVVSLAAGKKSIRKSFPGQPWRVRSQSEQMEIAAFLLRTSSKQSFNIQMKSPPSGQYSEIHFRNETIKTLEMIWMDTEGKEHLMKRLKPSESFFARTDVGHFWWARQEGSQQPIAMTKGLGGPQHFAITGETEGIGLSNTSTTIRKKPVFTAAFKDGQVNYMLQGSTFSILKTSSNGTPEKMYHREPGKINHKLPKNLLSDPDAVLSLQSGLIIFQGDQVQRYSLNDKQPEPGWETPRSIADYMPAYYSGFKKVDAAFPLPKSPMDIAPNEFGQAYLTCGNKYVLWDFNSNKKKSSGTLKSLFTGLPFANVDAAISTYFGVLFFSGTEYCVFNQFTKKVSKKDSIYKIPGVSAYSLALTPLISGEVELFQQHDFMGESLIVRGDVSNVQSLSGMKNRFVQSIRPGPNTGLTAYSETKFKGIDDVFTLPVSNISQTDIGGAIDMNWMLAIGTPKSYKVFESLSQEQSGISYTTVLGEEYRMKSGNMEKYKSYRTALTFPEGTKSVKIYATEEVDLIIGKETKTVDAIRSWDNLKPNAMNQLLINIEAVEMGVPGLQIVTEAMDSNQRFVVYPDEYVHQKIGEMGEDDLYDNATELGIDKNEVKKEDCRGVTGALKQLARAGEIMIGGSSVHLSDQPEYDAWGLDFGALGKKRATFFPMSGQEADEAFLHATPIDAGVGQWGIKSALKGIKKGAKGVAKVAVKSVNVVKDGVEEGLDELEDIAVDIGEGFEDVVPDEVKDLAKKALKVAISIGGEVVSFVVKAVEEIGAFVEFLVEQIGVLVEKFIEFLMSFFGWDDIMETQKIIIKTMQEGFDKFTDGFNDLKSNAASMISFSKNYLEDNSEKVDSFFRTSKLSTTKIPKLEIPGLKEFNWLLNKILNNIPNIDGPEFLSINNAFLEKKLNPIVSKVESLNISNSAFDELNSMTTLIVKNPENSIQYLLEGFESIFKVISDTSFLVAEAVLDLLLDITKVIMNLLGDTLTKHLKIPFVSDLYKFITGSDLSLLSLFALLIAIPITSILKLFRKASSQLGLLSQEKAIVSVEQFYKNGAYSFIHIILAYTTFQQNLNEKKWDSTNDKKFKTTANFYSFGNFSLGLIAQFLGFPVSAANHWNRGSSEARGLSDFFAKRIWDYQWALVGVDALNRIINAQATKLPKYPTANNTTKWQKKTLQLQKKVMPILTGSLGGLHLTGMFILGIFDGAQIAGAKEIFKELRGVNELNDESEFRKVMINYYNNKDNSWMFDFSEVTDSDDIKTMPLHELSLILNGTGSPMEHYSTIKNSEATLVFKIIANFLTTFPNVLAFSEYDGSDLFGGPPPLEGLIPVETNPKDLIEPVCHSVEGLIWLFRTSLQEDYL